MLMRRARVRASAPPQLGLRNNVAQFVLLIAVNALVGGMVGQERTILPLIAQRIFHIDALFSVLTFLLAFGVVKAVTNLAAGALADRYGRKPVLVAGWLAAIPIPALLMWGPSWGWIILANVLLGVNQGLAWSMTVIMKIDLVGPERRGFALGLNEAGGYTAVAATAVATGYIASHVGLRPEPFFLGVAFVVIGLALSTLAVRETQAYSAREAGGEDPRPSARTTFARTSLRDPALSACSQAGFVNNLNDGMAWGLLPLWFARADLSVAAIGVLAALYPAVWGVGQLVTGGLSDRIGRKKLIVAGMLLQAVAIGVIASAGSFMPWAWAAGLLGVGTAMVYPTLLAAIGDRAHPQWRASAVGVYRFWRDIGFAAGAIVTGVLGDIFGFAVAIWAVAALTAISGLLVAARMPETHPRPRALRSERR